MSLLEDSTTTSARMTPTKFSVSHTYGILFIKNLFNRMYYVISYKSTSSSGCFSIGSLIYVQPTYPTDGERAKVDIFRLDNLLLHDPIARDLRAHPGPLIKQVQLIYR